MHEHRTSCRYELPTGWRCTKDPWHNGSCALVPVWWKRLAYWIKGVPL